MAPLISPENTWALLGVIVSGAAASIVLEQRYPWATKISGPVLALILGMGFSNLHLVPASAPAYDVVDDYLVPIAVPLLLFRANLKRILVETRGMLAAFHVATAGSLLGSLLAGVLFRNSFDRVPEVAGIMAGSYIGGSVNFMAIKTTYQVSSDLANPLIVADNFIMAGMFAVLLVLSSSRFMLRHYPHPHTEDVPGTGAGLETQAAQHWHRKGVSLADVAKAIMIAVVVASLAMHVSQVVKSHIASPLVQSIFANAYVWITVFMVGACTLAHRWMESIQGADELGAWLLYLFFFVIGLRADFVAAIQSVPVLFLFCLVIAVVNLLVTLVVGRMFKMDLEELLLSVNATLGGPPSAVAMSVSKGWSRLILPGLLAGVWGYIIGTFLGILIAEILKAWK